MILKVVSVLMYYMYVCAGCMQEEVKERGRNSEREGWRGRERMERERERESL